MDNNMIPAIAMSLYTYNFSAVTRAEKLYQHFDGNCIEQEELVDILLNFNHVWATELPYPTAKAYLQHAMQQYGHEAQQRVTVNETQEATDG